MAEKKSAELKIRVIPSELESWRAAASERDMPLSAFVRAACNNEAAQTEAKPLTTDLLESQAAKYWTAAGTASPAPTPWAATSDGITVAWPREFLAPAITETGRRCPHGRQSGQWCPVCDR